MKTNKITNLLMVVAMFGFAVSSCNKDKTLSTNDQMTNQQKAQVQNSDVQDAVADKSDQDVDNTMDDLQANNYQVTSLKSALAQGTRTITVDHPDSTTFPKLITIVYVNWQDSTADESFIKNGEIDIYVTATGNNNQLISRAFTFKGFSVSTDSTTVSLNGTRSVARTSDSHNFTALVSASLVSLKVRIKENITANLRYAIVKTGQTDSLHFTRNVSKLRTSVLYYDNVGGTTWKAIKFRNNLSKDTITVSGTVTGTNEKGDEYSKTVGIDDPITINFFRNTPVVVSGTTLLSLTGTDKTASFTITYKQDLPLHPFMTLVTVTNNVTGKTHSFDRRFGRNFFRWW